MRCQGYSFKIALGTRLINHNHTMLKSIKKVTIWAKNKQTKEIIDNDHVGGQYKGQMFLIPRKQLSVQSQKCKH